MPLEYLTSPMAVIDPSCNSIKLNKLVLSMALFRLLIILYFFKKSNVPFSDILNIIAESCVLTVELLIPQPSIPPNCAGIQS